MGGIVSSIIWFLICLFFGAWNISNAIQYFREEKFYKTGLQIMLAFCMMVLIADMYF